MMQLTRKRNILIRLRILTIVAALTQDLGDIQNVIMLDATHSLAGTDTVGVVGVGVAVKLLQLATFFPSQGVTKVRNGVALLAPVYNYSSGMSISVNEEQFANAFDSITLNDSGRFKSVS